MSDELGDLNSRIYLAHGWEYSFTFGVWFDRKSEKRLGGRQCLVHQPPDYSRSIADAWELVEEAQAHEVGVLIHNSLMTFPNPGEWSYVVAFYDPIGGPMHKEYSAEAPTAPEAICEAWLAWKEGEK